MKQVWLVLVVLLAAIVPLPGYGGERAIGQVGYSSEESSGYTRPEPSRIIELDADKMRFRGNGGYWLRDNLAAMIRSRAHEVGIEIAVSGRAFGDIAETQDRIHGSGRYSRSSRQRVPVGKMVAADEQFRLTGIASVSYKRRGGNLPLGRRSRLSINQNEIEASVRLVLEPVDITSGLNRYGYEAKGEASRKDLRLAGRASSKYGNFSRSSSNVREEILQEAASNAVDELIRQIQRSY